MDEAARWRERMYQLTTKAYEAKFAHQGGRCAIRGCLNTPRAVDHDHACCPGTRTCGACVRGILCGPCNTRLGILENAAWIEAAGEYLGHYSKRRCRRGHLLNEQNTYCRVSGERVCRRCQREGLARRRAA